MSERKWYGISDPRNEEHTSETVQAIKDCENELWNDYGSVQDAIGENISNDLAKLLSKARGAKSGERLLALVELGELLLEDTTAYITADATKIITGVAIDD